MIEPDDTDIAALAREHGPRAIEVLSDVMECAVEDKDRIRAAESLLDRGHGKATQAVINVPASAKQKALAHALTDAEIVAIIEQKRLPRLSPSQPMVTIAPQPKASATMNEKKPKISHGPAVDIYGEESESQTDPLLA